MTDSPEREIIHRELDTEAEEPAIQIVEVVADIDDKDVAEMTSMWNCTDHVLDHLFSNPPSPEAQMRVEFSYENYRITVEQDGTAEFVKIN
jgi:hypothetical protein